MPGVVAVDVLDVGFATPEDLMPVEVVGMAVLVRLCLFCKLRAGIP